jgi:hypothetical protein
VEFLKDEPSQTLVEFMNISKAEKTGKNHNENIKNGLQNIVVMTKNAEFSENNKFKEKTEGKDNKLIIEYLLQCSMLRVRPRYTFLDKPINSCL